MASAAAPAVKPTGPPFLRFNARLGWPLGPVESRPAIPHADRDLALAIAGRSPIALIEPFGTFGGRTLPRGLAIGSEGRLFLADPGRRVVLTALAGDGGRARPAEAPATWPFVPLWPARPLPGPRQPHDLEEPGPPADPFTLVRPVDVALGPNGDLVVVDEGAARVLVLAFPTARLRHVLEFPGGAPSAVAFDAAGRAYVAVPGHHTVARFDRRWRRDPAFPEATLQRPRFLAAAAGGGPCGRPAGEPCAPLPAPDAVVHVLDEGRLVSLDVAGRPVAAAEAALRLAPPPLRREASGDLAWADPMRPGHQPILLPGLELTADGRHKGSGLPLLALPRRVEVPRFGAFTTTMLDSGRTGFAWDRLTLVASLPPTTRLVVTTLTSEVAIPFDRLDSLAPERWSVPVALLPGDLPEVLIQSAAGRYLWVRVELSGDGGVSPSIAELDIHGPRRSAMRYLPASFHEDPESFRFLDRFLSYFDTVFAEIRTANRETAALFDPEVVPAAFLAWLGSWFDLEFLATWPEATRRRMIQQAIGFFRRRGTVAGLRQILQWHTGLADPLPQVIEHFRLAGRDEPLLIGGAVLDPGTPAHAFTIVMPAHLVAEPGSRAVLERLIAANVPAHARWQLRLTEPGVVVGRQSTLGVDMLLAGPGGDALGAGRLGATLATGPALPEALLRFPPTTGPRPLKGALPC